MKVFLDFIPALLFFLTYFGVRKYEAAQGLDTSNAIYAATAVIIVATLVTSFIAWRRTRRLDRMQLAVLGLVLVLGGFTLWLRDPVFIKWKPTLVNWGFGAAFLVSQFWGRKNLVERIMSEQIAAPPAVWRRLNFAWVLFFAGSGAANIYVAYTFDESVWVNFKLFGMLALTFLFIIGQMVFLARFVRSGDDDVDHQHRKNED